MHIKVVSDPGNVSYMKRELARAISLLDTELLCVHHLVITSLGPHSRGYYNDKYRTVYMNPHAKSFWPDYRGYKYKVFGRVLDLTPGGVFLHECGHAFASSNPHAVRAFHRLRKTDRKSVSSYGSTCTDEDIAESFRLFVSNSALLAELKPSRYTILDKYARKYLVQYNGGNDE